MVGSIRRVDRIYSIIYQYGIIPNQKRIEHSLEFMIYRADKVIGTLKRELQRDAYTFSVIFQGFRIEVS